LYPDNARRLHVIEVKVHPMSVAKQIDRTIN
jgi:hypothetical protein